jgi:hypothetical protein
MICCYCLCDGLDIRLPDKKLIFHNNLLLMVRSFYCVLRFCEDNCYISWYILRVKLWNAYWTMNRMECGKILLWNILKYYSWIWLEALRETTANLSHNIQCPSGDSNWTPLDPFHILPVEVYIYLLLVHFRYFVLVWFYIIWGILYICILYQVHACVKKSLIGKEEENLSSQSRTVLGHLLVTLRRYFYITLAKFWPRLILCNSSAQTMRVFELPPWRTHCGLIAIHVMLEDKYVHMVLK